MTDYEKQQLEQQLTFAQQVYADLKAAYQSHAANGRAFTHSYKIKDREMTFNSLADLLKALRWWEQEILRPEIALGKRPGRARRIITRFAE